MTEPRAEEESTVLDTGDPPASSPADPGRSWGKGRYRIERTLGKGAMGIVLLALDLSRSERVVIKAMRDAHAANAGMADRFRREIFSLTRLRHPRIATLLDSGVEDRPGGALPWYSTEYRAGTDLKEWASGRVLPLRWSLLRLAEVAEAAGRAHEQGFVHRDIKPANLLVEGKGEAMCLIDWGLVKVLLAEESYLRSSASQVLGTPAYMAPEQLFGEAVGPATDVYSLGGVLLWLLTGVPPNRISGDLAWQALRDSFRAPPLSLAAWPHLDRELERICHRALAVDPARRFADGSAFARELRAYVERHDAAPAHVLRVLEPGPPSELRLSGDATIGGVRVVRTLSGYGLVAGEKARPVVNGEAVETWPLEHGDRIRIGVAEYAYRREAES